MDTLIPQHKLLIIKTQPRVLKGRGSLYYSVSWAWRIDPKRAATADYVLGCVDDVCRGVFVANAWLPATEANFPHFADPGHRPDFPHHRPERHGFIGQEAPDSICGIYENKFLPERQQGGQNAIRYINC